MDLLYGAKKTQKKKSGYKNQYFDVTHNDIHSLFDVQNKTGSQPGVFHIIIMLKDMM